MQKKALFIGIAVVVVIAGAATYHRSQRNAEKRMRRLSVGLYLIRLGYWLSLITSQSFRMPLVWC